MVGAIPDIYRALGAADSLDVYFAMARGTQTGTADESCSHGHGKSGDVPALEMTNWFDTNYHHMVPEVTPGTSFQPTPTTPLAPYPQPQPPRPPTPTLPH